MQLFLIMLFVLVLLTGIVLGVVNRKKQVTFVGIITATIIINLPIFLIIVNVHEDTLKEEIKRVIAERNGHVIEIIKIGLDDSKETPFKDQVSKNNILFKVKYSVDEQVYTAWYRAVNTLNNIHNQDPGPYGAGFGEKWVFEE